MWYDTPRAVRIGDNFLNLAQAHLTLDPTTIMYRAQKCIIQFSIQTIHVAMEYSEFFLWGTEAKLKLSLKRWPDSSVSSLIRAGWRQEGHLVTKISFQHSHGSTTVLWWSFLLKRLIILWACSRITTKVEDITKVNIRIFTKIQHPILATFKFKTCRLMTCWKKIMSQLQLTENFWRSLENGNF